MSDEITETQLDWEEAEKDTYEARGTDYGYVVSRGGDEWLAQHGDEELGWRGDPEAAKRLCQLHRDSELAWRESAQHALWVAASAVLAPSEDYSCAVSGHDDGAPWAEWQAAHCEHPIGDPTTLELAKEACQAHHRELVMGDAAEEPEPDPERLPAEPPKLKWRKVPKQPIWRSKVEDPGLAYTVAEVEDPLAYVAVLSGEHPETLDTVVVGDDGKESARETAQRVCESHAAKQQPAATAAEPDTGELGDWSIPVQLTEPELARLGQQLGELMVGLGRETLRITRAKDACKKAVKAAEAAIEDLNAEALPVAENLDTGQEYRLVRCRQHKDPEAGELYYTDPETGEELHRRAVPKGEQQELFGSKVPPPADKPPEFEFEPADTEPPPADEAADPPADPLPLHLDISIKLSWRHLTDGRGQKVYATGESYPRYYVDKDDEGKRRVQYQPAEGESRLVPRASGASPPRLKDCFAAAHADNQTRIRWGKPVPSDEAYGEPCMVLSRPCEGLPGYQLTRQEPDAEGRDWHAERIGGQDEDNTDLLAHDGLPAAKAACQADADERRAGQ
jgi:hypothetical protein